MGKLTLFKKSVGPRVYAFIVQRLSGSGNSRVCIATGYSYEEASSKAKAEFKEMEKDPALTLEKITVNGYTHEDLEDLFEEYSEEKQALEKIKK